MLKPPDVARIDEFLATLHEALKAKGYKVAVAESLTGGALGAAMASRDGASKVFVGGAITYTNEEKVRQCGVTRAALTTHSAVSEEVARQMATGIRWATGADIGISTTGYAGPGPGERGEPAGTFYVGVALADDLDMVVTAHGYLGEGGRNAVRFQAVAAALYEACQILNTWA